MKDLAVGFVKSAYTPYNATIYNHAVFMKSRHRKSAELQDYVRSLALKSPDDKPEHTYFSTQHWYPRMWDDWARDKDHANPDDAFADESNLDLDTKSRRIQFRPLRPSLASNYVHHSSPRWANEISFRFYGSDEYLAQVFPNSSGDHSVRAFSSFASFKGDWRIGRNGIVKLVTRTLTEHWDVPLAQNVFFGWLRDLEWDAELSTAGLIARHLYTQLEGAPGTFRDERLLKLIEGMNGGPTEEREMPVAEAKNRLKQIRPGLHDYLLSRRVFRLGCKVQCPQCSRNSWFNLDSIRETLTCPRCSGEWQAIGNVDAGKWCYKTAGPFSVPGYADGAYCVLLALEFFAGIRMINISATPVFSFTAKHKDGKPLEADFGLLWQQSMFGSVADGVLFGECKTFGTFDQRDYERMTWLAAQFPGAVLAFCTLRKQLTPVEVQRITRIAKAGRKRWKTDRSLNPVLVLTGTELLDDLGPPYCWEKINLAKKFERAYGLLEICDATQQIHLNLSPLEEDWHQEFEKKKYRRAKKVPAE